MDRVDFAGEYNTKIEARPLQPPRRGGLASAQRPMIDTSRVYTEFSMFVE